MNIYDYLIAAVIGGTLTLPSFIEMLRPHGMSANVKQIREFDEMIKVQKNWTHKEKIKALQEDGLSDQFVRELVKSSKKQYDLQALKEWCLRNSDRRSMQLLKEVQKKMDALDEKQILQELIQTIKSKGTSCIEIFFI
jgi:hypothetical protein